MAPRSPGSQLALTLAVVAGLAGAGAADARDDEPAAAVAVRGAALRAEAETAYAWRTEAGEDVLLLEGGDARVNLTVDGAELAADDAVVWLAPEAGGETVRALVALVGGAELTRGEVVRSGERLLVDVRVPRVALGVDQRTAADASRSGIYQAAVALRPGLGTGPVDAPPAYLPGAAAGSPVSFRAGSITTRATEDGTALVLAGGAFLIQERPDGSVLELEGRRAVLFTRLADLAELAGAGRDAEGAVESAYVEGDVRVRFTPPPGGGGEGLAEQRLEAGRVFYEFDTDRAVLTDATLRTREPRRDLPVTLRAETIRQVARGRYEADDAELSFSRFARPEYALNAGRITVDQRDVGGARGTRTAFRADDLTLRAYGLPFLYLPAAGGVVDERPFPLESVALDNRDNFGTGVLTRWGLFETLGLDRPEGTDAGYALDYFSERGPAAGLDFDYARDAVAGDGTATGFAGTFTAYGVYDEGTDDLARRRADIDWDGDLRGRVLFEHEQTFGGDWRGQFRLGYVSDATFLEEWFEREFRDGLPHKAEAYLARSRGTEQFGILIETPTNDIVTVSGLIQEQFTLRRLPEVSYFRSGDRLGDLGGTGFTFYSANTAGLLEFVESDADLFGADEGDLGYRNPGSTPDLDEAFVGLPSAGYTGLDRDPQLTGDFRQQFDFPLRAGPVNVVPYAVARYTGYEESPGEGGDGGDEHRLLGALGLRASVAFVKTDDAVRSELFDVNRVRHVVEPNVHLFASGQTTEREDVYVYESFRDGYSDVKAARLGVRQRWQTKRGGPGRERSVDFLTLDVAVDLFADTPPEVTRPIATQIEPFDAGGFRGLFYETRPENSIARDAVNVQGLWRVSDTTVVLGDLSHNLGEGRLATAAAGLAAERGPRLGYTLGTRYLGEIHTTLAYATARYRLGDKYALAGSYAVNVNGGESRGYSLRVSRGFERYALNFAYFVDQVRDESGVRLSLAPKGFDYDLDLDVGR